MYFDLHIALEVSASVLTEMFEKKQINNAEDWLFSKIGKDLQIFFIES